MEENDSNTGLVLAETSKETHQDRLELLLAENPHKSFAVALFLVQLRLALQTDRTDSSSIDDMNTIYNQASITIIAAAGESSSYGLPGVGQRSRTIPNNFTLNGTTWRYKPMSFKSHVGASKWSTRGWTYQEAVFSRRCVIFADDQVFYQCGCMTCAEELIQDFAICERTVFPIFERILYKDSDIGTYLPRSWRFMTNLEAYSKRELTYDSDVLRAMEGVFGFYAQLEPSVEQYWGLPLRWAGCQLSNLDEKNVYHVAKSKHNDVMGAILWAMLWEPAWSEYHILKTGFVRRDGFPTWSWSGWKAGVRWNFLENVEHLEKSFTAPLFVETTAGGLVELNDALARPLTSGQSYASLGLTYILRITTKVFDVPFIERAPYKPTTSWAKSDSFPARRKGQHWVTKEDHSFEGKWTHFVVQKNIETSERGLVWSLDLTHGGAATSSDLVPDIDTNVNPMTLRCIVISYDYGMIVQCSSGISKRVGLLRFEGEFFENGRINTDEYGHHDDSVKWPWTDSVQSKDLRDHFPGVERTVRLG
ncbi:tol protein [Fusarium fujikuroi]|nr:tol protein [Fusarium fujikuroi]